jgi:hypothetical protein
LLLDQKAALLASIRPLNAPGGALLMIDAVRREGESRREFYQRYLADVRGTWTDLSSAEVESIEAHITSSD